MEQVRTTLGEIFGRHTGRTFTAAVARVERGHGCVVQLAAGQPDPAADPLPITVTTPFDLASLTKLFTASAVLRLVAGRQLELDQPVRACLPRFLGRAKDRVTIRHLLTHTSGLPPLLQLFGPAAPAGDPWDAILGCDLQAEPGASVAYSDVGFMLLGKLVEAVAGEPLRATMRRLVLDPLALDTVQYGPCPAAPATELDPWRGRRIRGEVHDENAAVLGGAAGHAGLFGSAGDMARLARTYLWCDESFLSPRLIDEAVREQAFTGYERRGLGWKLASRSAEAPESTFSSQSFGHYGFTGTAVWTDPVRNLTVVLLTNRVYFGRDATRIAALRREVFAAIAAASKGAQ